MSNKLSICYTCKNRSNLPSKHGNLPLLRRSVASVLGACISIGVEFEIVISDWKSTDTDYKWLPKQSKLVTIDQEEFSRGYGRNFAAKNAKNDILLFLDADMLIGKQFIAKCTYATTNDKTVYFPQCWCVTEGDRKKDEKSLISKLPSHQVRYTTKEGIYTRSGWANLGFGCCCISIKDFKDSGGWPEYYSWGREDPDFYDFFVQNEYNIIRERASGLVHMWHPPARDV